MNFLPKVGGDGGLLAGSELNWTLGSLNLFTAQVSLEKGCRKSVLPVCKFTFQLLE
ncbi:MAG: hypothetical protein DVB28_001588 [Verrucomicrobia bacterium]|nr:MAG: hypothetical protein DVB28_001588 [Verrucomicrobiota bacterium]